MYVLYYAIHNEKDEVVKKDFKLASTIEDCEKYAKEHNLDDYNIALDLFQVQQLEHKIESLNNTLKTITQIANQKLEKN